MRAWVLTLTILNAGSKRTGQSVLLTIVSARRTTSQVKRRLQELWLVLRESLADQVACARYNRPAELPSVHITSGVRITGFDHPYLFEAQFADLLNDGEPDELGRYWWRGVPYAPVSVNEQTFELEFGDEIVPEIKKTKPAFIELGAFFDHND